MATKHHNLSQLNAPLPSAEEMKFGIVVAEWNSEVTEGLLNGAVRTLRSAGCPDHNIQIKYVPGTFELSLGAQFFAEYTDVDAVIVLGCVIQGDTRHFDFVCQGVTQGVMQLQLQWNMPVAFGVLTTDNLQQALDRSADAWATRATKRPRQPSRWSICRTRWTPKRTHSTARPSTDPAPGRMIRSGVSDCRNSASLVSFAQKNGADHSAPHLSANKRQPIIPQPQPPLQQQPGSTNPS